VIAIPIRHQEIALGIALNYGIDIVVVVSTHGTQPWTGME
jgi:hypothetical protein